MTKRLIMAVALGASMLLSACAVPTTATAPSVPAVVAEVAAGGPVVLADRTKIDEQAAITITLAYTAAGRAAALAIETGLIKDTATIKHIGELNNTAYAAVVAVNEAYKAGNSAGFAEALVHARVAVSDLLAITKGN